MLFGRKWFRKNDKSKLQWLIFPTNKNNFHWWSYYVDIRNQKIYWIDSLRNNQVEESYLQNIQAYLKKWKFSEIDFEVKKLEVPTQNNGKDCGVFTIMFAVYFTDPNNFAELNSLQKVEPILCNSLFRKRIGLYILNGRID